MNPRRTWGVAFAVAITVTGCVSSDRQRVPGAADSAGADDSADAAEDGVGADAADAAPGDATDARDSSSTGDTRIPDAVVRDTADTADTSGLECTRDRDCAGVVGACQGWVCANHRCETVAFGHAEQLEGTWYLTSTTVAEGGVRTLRGTIELESEGAWALDEGSLLSSTATAGGDASEGQWCVSPAGEVQLHAAGSGELRHLYGQLADGQEIIALGARGGAQLTVLVRPNQAGAPLETASTRYRAIGLRTTAGAAEGYAGWLRLSTEKTRGCSGALTTSGGATLSFASGKGCLTAESDGRVEMEINLTVDGTTTRPTRWYGYAAAGGAFLVMSQDANAAVSDSPPLPGLMLLVREASEPALRLGGTYATMRVGVDAAGGPLGTWGEVHYTLGGDIDYLRERDTLLGEMGFAEDGCGSAGGSDCSGFYTVNGGQQPDKGAVVETITGVDARTRGGQALSLELPGRAAPLWVSYARAAASEAPTRPSIGLHVRRLEAITP